MSLGFFLLECHHTHTLLFRASLRGLTQPSLACASFLFDLFVESVFFIHEFAGELLLFFALLSLELRTPRLGLGLLLGNGALTLVLLLKGEVTSKLMK